MAHEEGKTQPADAGPVERPVRRLDDGLPADAVRFAGDAPQMRVCRMDDMEWWVGESLAACVAEGRRQCGADCYPDSDEQHELSDAELQRPVGEHWTVGVALALRGPQLVGGERHGLFRTTQLDQRHDRVQPVRRLVRLGVQGAGEAAGRAQLAGQVLEFGPVAQGSERPDDLRAPAHVARRHQQHAPAPHVRHVGVLPAAGHGGDQGRRQPQLAQAAAHGVRADPEQALRLVDSVVDSIDVAICVFDPGQHLLLANPTALALLQQPSTTADDGFIVFRMTESETEFSNELITS